MGATRGEAGEERIGEKSGEEPEGEKEGVRAGEAVLLGVVILQE
jgi:hypothetical protein